MGTPMKKRELLARIQQLEHRFSQVNDSMYRTILAESKGQMKLMQVLLHRVETLERLAFECPATQDTAKKLGIPQFIPF